MLNVKGTVVQIMGPVLDIRFPEGQLPELLNAVEVPNGDGCVVAEVAQHIGDNVARCIAMSSTDGLTRGVEAIDTGKGITVPVGRETLGRVFNLLGDPIGNIDTGSVVGSYIGLLFLGSAFVSIGLFSSVLTNNQIVAFIVAILLSVFCYLGFETLYNMDIFGSLNLFARSLGMRYHYESISRGVIDTRDVLYFLSVIALFVMLTRLVLQSRKWQK